MKRISLVSLLKIELYFYYHYHHQFITDINIVPCFFLWSKEFFC